MARCCRPRGRSAAVPPGACLWLVCWFLAGPPASAGQEADWPDDPGDFDFDAVNEGELVFLENPPEKPVHTHRNRITLTARSLVDGWAALYQCHSRLDPVPATQIVFRPGRVRHLQVEEYTAIGAVRVEGDTVQLEDIRPGARLCLSAESRVVRTDGGGGFAVHNGPFMRGFLDGYYPMHVVLEIGLPPGDWKLVRSEPAAQRGFDIRTTADSVSADAWFSGRLRTEFHFMPSQTEPRQSGSTDANDRQ